MRRSTLFQKIVITPTAKSPPNPNLIGQAQELTELTGMFAYLHVYVKVRKRRTTVFEIVEFL